MKTVIKTISKPTLKRNKNNIKAIKKTSDNKNTSDNTVAVRDYVAGKGYSGIVDWDGKNPTVAGVKVNPTEIRDGISYAKQSDMDKILSDYENRIGIKNAEKSRNEKYGDAENQAFLNIVNREPFSYDPENDVVYQAYKKQYERQAEHALRRILNDNNTSIAGADSAVLSEAMAAQNEQLKKISDAVPELYSDAYDRYIKEGELLNDTLKTIVGIANDYYDRVYKSDSDIIDRANKAGYAERQERQRQVDNQRNGIKDYYDNALKAIELNYSEDKLKSDIAKTQASTQNTVMNNAIARGFFIEADEELMPWLSKYKEPDGTYAISPSVAKVAYEYNAAHERERGKINAKLGR